MFLFLSSLSVFFYYYYYYSHVWLLEACTSNTLLKRIGESEHLLTWTQRKALYISLPECDIHKGCVVYGLFLC